MVKKSAHKSITHTSFFQLVLLCALAISVGTFLYFTSPKKTEITEPTPEPTAKDIYREGIKRCGDVPNTALKQYGSLGDVSNYYWSPDCKYISYTVALRAFGWVSPKGETTTIPSSKNEGVYLYSVSTKKTIVVFKSKQQSPYIKEWKDSKLYFNAGDKDYTYNVNIGKLTKL